MSAYSQIDIDRGFIITDREVKNKIVGLIENDLLTADMNRVRSGRTQLFRKDYGDRHFIREENADVILKHSEKHIYAELIAGKWYWINGCCECNEEERDWVNSYIECVTHDVCSMCSISRSHLNGPAWGRKNGWACKPCVAREKEEEKNTALALMGEYDEWDYFNLKIPKCPHCDYEMKDGQEVSEFYEADETLNKCYRCDNEYFITAEHEIKFTMKKIEPKEVKVSEVVK